MLWKIDDIFCSRRTFPRTLYFPRIFPKVSENFFKPNTFGEISRHVRPVYEQTGQKALQVPIRTSYGTRQPEIYAAQDGKIIIMREMRSEKEKSAHIYCECSALERVWGKIFVRFRIEPDQIKKRCRDTLVFFWFFFFFVF